MLATSTLKQGLEPVTLSNTTILICGGRDYTDYHTFTTKMEEISGKISGPITVISGGARGADTLAIRWANDYGHKLEVYVADWDRHKKAAGILRNIQMLKEGEPDLVVAFPGGRGTAHMIGISEKAGIKVVKLLDTN